MVGIAAVALVLASRHGWFVGALVVGAAAAVKLPAGVVGIGVVLVTLPLAASVAARLTRAAQVAAVALGTVAGVGVLSRLGIGWVHALGVPGEVETPLSLSTQLGRLAHLVTGVDLVGAFRGLASVALLAMGAAVLLRSRPGHREGALRGHRGGRPGVRGAEPGRAPLVRLLVPAVRRGVRAAARGRRTLLHVSWLGGLVAPLDSSLREPTTSSPWGSG